MRLIDGDELLERVWRFGLGTREDIANLVKSMPTVSTKQGRWIVFSDKGISGHECSECGFHKLKIDDYAYCPNCGAKMREDGGEGC